MFPSWVLGLNLGTINPLTIGIDAENQWGYLFCCQSYKDVLAIILAFLSTDIFYVTLLNSFLQ